MEQQECSPASSLVSTCTKARKLFKSTSFVSALLFSYFLQMIKTGKVNHLHMMLKTMPDLLRKYEKQVKVEVRKTFLSKLMDFSEELSYLGTRVDEGGMVDWLFYEAFASFED